MIPDPIAAVVSFLKDDGPTYGAVSGRIYGSEMPDTETVNQPRAAIVVKATGGGLLMGRSFIELADRRLDIMCYGTTPYQAGLVQRTMHSALKQMRRNVQGSCLLHWAHPNSEPVALRDPDAEWPMVLSVWQVLASEKEVS